MGDNLLASAPMSGNAALEMHKSYEKTIADLRRQLSEAQGEIERPGGLRDQIKYWQYEHQTALACVKTLEGELARVKTELKHVKDGNMCAMCKAEALAAKEAANETTL